MVGTVVVFPNRTPHKFEYANSCATNVIVKSGVQTLSCGMFFNCYRISNIQFEEPCRLQIIAECAFEKCTYLTEFQYNQNVLVCTQAFKHCTSLYAVKIASTDVWPDTFAGCSNLMLYTNPEKEVTFHINSWNGCSALTMVKANTINNIEYIIDSNQSIRCIICDNIEAVYEAQIVMTRAPKIYFYVKPSLWLLLTHTKLQIITQSTFSKVWNKYILECKFFSYKHTSNITFKRAMKSLILSLSRSEIYIPAELLWIIVSFIDVQANWLPIII